jgi:hypothetical protein
MFGYENLFNILKLQQEFVLELLSNHQKRDKELLQLSTASTDELSKILLRTPFMLIRRRLASTTKITNLLIELDGDNDTASTMNPTDVGKLLPLASVIPCLRRLIDIETQPKEKFSESPIYKYVISRKLRLPEKSTSSPTETVKTHLLAAPEYEAIINHLTLDTLNINFVILQLLFNS